MVERLDGIRREFVAGDNFSFLTPSLLRLVLFSPSDPPTNLFSNYFPWPALAVRDINLSRLKRYYMVLQLQKNREYWSEKLIRSL